MKKHVYSEDSGSKIRSFKKLGKKVDDNLSFQTACSSVCSSNAIVFGDSNDPSHQIYDLKDDSRKYDLLDHLNMAPSVFYQTKVRNKS